MTAEQKRLRCGYILATLAAHGPTSGLRHVERATKDIDVAIGRALADADRLRKTRPPVRNPSKIRPLEDLADPASVERLNQLVTDVMSGDAMLATPTPLRQPPERDASLGGKGVGVGQHHLHVVPEGRVIDATGRFNARRRNHFNNGSAA